MSDFTLNWSREFGLAHTPLFETGEIDRPENHAVLLDGSDGSFVLSEMVTDTLDPRAAASWAWSAAIPSHVVVDRQNVSVVGWGLNQQTDTFTLPSVLGRLDSFYEYLQKRRSRGRKDVVSTLIGGFRSVRAELANSGADDAASVPEFLDVIAELMLKDAKADVRKQNFFNSWQAIKGALGVEVSLSSLQRERIEYGLVNEVDAAFGLQLLTSLSVRHAASTIFQESHFAFETSGQFDLFGYQSDGRTTKVTRGAHHFTPASLARSICEQVMHTSPDLATRSRLSVLDPACGSGAFLTEIARTLRRFGFEGELQLIGRDISRPAIMMAHFALEAARSDWEPKGGIIIDLEASDSLDTALPKADVVLMNPPFLAWPMMTRDQRDQVAAALGPLAQHRPDLSMAFITRALSAVNRNGIVASLAPASVLQLDSAKAWRKDLLTSNRLAFLGSFGDFGLFVHAMVQVAAIVLVVGDDDTSGIAMRISNQAKATGEALRALRRLGGKAVTEIGGSGYRISPISKDELANADRWRILPAGVDSSLRRLTDLGMATLDETFDVKQGLLTGLNDAFVLTMQQLNKLPEAERRYFRPALFRDAISGGELHAKYFVYFPYSASGLIFTTDAEARDATPTYFSVYLSPLREKLSKRSGVGGAKAPWWALSRYYSWVQRKEARILTKYFGGVGDFAVDTVGEYVPLQGYAWFLKREAKNAAGSDADDVLAAYLALVNAPTFARLLKVFSDPVAGGQSNLSARFVRPVPLPDVSSIKRSRAYRRLVDLGQMKHAFSPQWLAEIDQLASQLWGEELVNSLMEMDDA